MAKKSKRKSSTDRNTYWLIALALEIVIVAIIATVYAVNHMSSPQVSGTPSAADLNFTAYAPSYTPAGFMSPAGTTGFGEFSTFTLNYQQSANTGVSYKLFESKYDSASYTPPANCGPADEVSDEDSNDPAVPCQKIGAQPSGTTIYYSSSPESDNAAERAAYTIVGNTKVGLITTDGVLTSDQMVQILGSLQPQTTDQVTQLDSSH